MRYGLLARVSGEEQVEGYSLDAQVRAFNTLVETREGSVYHQWIEEGVSARTDDISKRPLFRKAIDEALAGRYDVLVVHKLDRFSRNVRITLEKLEKLEKAGVGFVSITEQMDFSTPIGSVILANLAAFGQYYSDNLSAEVSKGLKERAAQGASGSGRCRSGTRRVTTDPWKSSRERPRRFSRYSRCTRRVTRPTRR